MRGSRIVAALLVLALGFGVSCDRGVFDSGFIRRMNTLVEGAESHGHARIPLIDRQSFSLLRWLWFFHFSFYSYSDSGAPPTGSAELLAAAELEALAQGAESTEWKARDPFYDHSRDGAWSGRADVRTTDDRGHLVTGGVPFVLLVNAPRQGRPLVSLLFQNTYECMEKERAGWTAVYSDRFPPEKPGFNAWEIDGGSSRLLSHLVPGLAKLDFSYRLRDYNDDTLAGTGLGFLPGEAEPLVYTSDRLYRMPKPGVLGLWSGGLMARPYVGEFLEPLFQPVTLSLVEKYAGPELVVYVLLSRRESIDAKIRGKRLTFEYSTSNGRASGDFELRGTRLVGTMFDPLSGQTLELTFLPAGTEGIRGRKPKLKRVTPSSLDLGRAGATHRLTVVGKNFADGAMVFFDDDRLAVRSVEYLSKKKLAVGVEVLEPMAGAAIGVRVLNPDNRAADKGRAVRSR